MALLETIRNRRYEIRGDRRRQHGEFDAAEEEYAKSNSYFTQAKRATLPLSRLRHLIKEGESFDVSLLEAAKKAHFTVVGLLSDTLDELRLYDGILMSSLSQENRTHQAKLVGQASELTVLALFLRNFAKNENILAVPSNLKADFQNGKKAYDIAVFSIYSPYEEIPVQVKTNAHADHHEYYDEDIALIGVENICADSGASLRDVQEKLILERHGIIKKNDGLMDEIFQKIIEKISQTDPEYDRKMRLGKLGCEASLLSVSHLV